MIAALLLAAALTPQQAAHAYLRECTLATATGEYGAAMRACRKAERIRGVDASDVDAAVDPLAFEAENRCERRIGAGNWRGAAADCEIAFEIHPDEPHLSILRGRIELHKGWYADAFADFHFAATVYPSGEAFYWRGYTNLLTKNYADAVADFSSAIKNSYDVGTRQSAYYEYRSRAYLAEGRRAAALDDWRTAVAIYAKAGDCAGAVHAIAAGSAIFRTNDFAQKRCIPNPAIADARQCRRYARTGALEAALPYCRDAQKIDFDMQARGVAAAVRDLGRRFVARCNARRAARDLTGAWKDCAAANDLLPGERAPQLARGRLELQAGRTAQAFADFDSAARLYPPSGEAFFWRACANTLKKDDAAARADFSLAAAYGYREEQQCK